MVEAGEVLLRAGYGRKFLSVSVNLKELETGGVEMGFTLSRVPLSYKINRIQTPNTRVRGKRYLTQEEKEKLLESDDLIYEEKLDGKQVILENEEHPGLLFVGELMSTTHTIFYMKLPSTIYFFDVFDIRTHKFLAPDEKMPLILEAGGVPPRVISTGPTDTEELEKMLFGVRSGFSSSVNPAMREKILKEKLKLSTMATFVLNNIDFIEGLVLKSYRHRIMGKVVNPAFEEFIDRLGRYENYPCRNIIFPYSFDEYEKYVDNVMSELSKVGCAAGIPQGKLKRNYRAYMSACYLYYYY
jgi:hypothetical protein